MLDELGDLPGLERRREEKLRRLRHAGEFRSSARPRQEAPEAGPETDSYQGPR